MYRNLNTGALGITGRQSELIELALTYGFGGLDLDMAQIAKRARVSGIEQAKRFIASAGIQGGEFTLPVEIGASEAEFRSKLVELGEVAEVAAALEARCCHVVVPPVSDGAPYQESFELQRSRLAEIGDVLAGHSIRLGVDFQPAPSHWKDAETPLINTSESLMTLLRTVGNANVGLALDTWKWFVGGGSLENLLAIPIETIVSVRLADIPADADLSTITDDDRYMPGTGGLVDCRAIVQHLNNSDYAGPLTLYPSPSRFAGMTRDAIVQQARATLDDLFNPTPTIAEEPTGGDQVAETDTPTEQPADTSAEAGAVSS